ncbi:uncharacterized protein LOC121382176 [Gigantopelta aegis]|uniref:uncharacterized protein LOC121382176 n=1 Tax=Gigantopelta aegis TaxID=1735272 RepID=UPI001B887B71|nr:uncharacterized protein LOC121382176 [Gigantopelta aegis]
MLDVRTGSHGPSARRQMAQKCIRRYARMQRKHAYRRLREIVPSVAKKEKASKVTIVEEAVKYIDILHERFMKRFNSPDDMDSVKKMVLTLMLQKESEDRSVTSHAQLPVPRKTASQRPAEVSVHKRAH